LLGSAHDGYNRGFSTDTPLRRSSALGAVSNQIQETKESIMVVIRLARGGAKKRPFFNIVATDSRNPRDGRFIERVGFYNPVAAENEPKLRIAADRLSYWTGVGARMSPTVARLVKEHTPAAA
jgi:small subunit ribosomal protein S16